MTEGIIQEVFRPYLDSRFELISKRGLEDIQKELIERITEIEHCNHYYGKCVIGELMGDEK